MLNLVEAIVEKVKSTPALSDALKGGFHWLSAPQKQPMPYCVLESISGTPEYATGTDVIETDVMQFTFYASQIAPIQATIEAFKKAFVWQPLTAGSDAIFGARLNNEHGDYEAADEVLLAADKYILEIEFWIDTTL